ncbi:hypothetical protein NDU88_002927 [Pleurodeles waltl]|uniref:Uncharacterized protein n=1 Tax=Pleurodeles waltl TaxID=8319 RepID=A0AAV7T4M8_PLEWA|nr:hypothetical protein NDU88_002927 [Pleurodeles waltl]
MHEWQPSATSLVECLFQAKMNYLQRSAARQILAYWPSFLTFFQVPALRYAHQKHSVNFSSKFPIRVQCLPQGRLPGSVAVKRASTASAFSTVTAASVTSTSLKQKALDDLKQVTGNRKQDALTKLAYLDLRRRD